MEKEESGINAFGHRHPVPFGVAIGLVAFIATVAFWIITDTEITAGGFVVRLMSCVSLAAVSTVLAKQSAEKALKPTGSRMAQGSGGVKAEGVKLVSLVAKNRRATVQASLLAAPCLVHGILIAAGDVTVVLGAFAVGFVVMFPFMAVGTILVVKELRNAQSAPPGFQVKRPSLADYRPIDQVHQVSGILYIAFIIILDIPPYSGVMAGIFAGFAATFALTSSVVRSKEKKQGGMYWTRSRWWKYLEPGDAQHEKFFYSQTSTSSNRSPI